MKKPQADAPIRVIVTKLPEAWKQSPGTDHIRLKGPIDREGYQRAWAAYLDQPLPIDDELLRALAASGAEWRYAEGSRRVPGIEPLPKDPEPKPKTIYDEAVPKYEASIAAHQAELRDRFAIAALTGYIADIAVAKGDVPISTIATDCYRLADAMIAERDKRKT